MIQMDGAVRSNVRIALVRLKRNEPAAPCGNGARRFIQYSGRRCLRSTTVRLRRLRVNHVSSVVMMVMMVTMPTAVMPVMYLTESAAGTSQDEHESEKGTKLFHP